MNQLKTLPLNAEQQESLDKIAGKTVKQAAKAKTPETPKEPTKPTVSGPKSTCHSERYC